MSLASGITGRCWEALEGVMKFNLDRKVGHCIAPPPFP